VIKNCITSFAIILLALLASSPSLAQRVSNRNHAEEGRTQAKQDLARGIYKLQIVQGVRTVIGHDCDSPSREEIYQSILKDKYQIELNVDYIGDVGDWDNEIDFANSYNEVSRPAIQSKFGADVLEKAYQQALNEFQENYAVRDEKCKQSQPNFEKNIRSLPKRQPK